MERTHSRLVVWGLGLICFTLMAENGLAQDRARASRFKSSPGENKTIVPLSDTNQPRVEGGGWFPTPNFSAPNGTAKVNFGITGKNDNSGAPQGEFEYHNDTTGLNVHLKITSLDFHPTSDDCLIFEPQLAGLPAATLGSPCDDGTP